MTQSQGALCLTNTGSIDMTETLEMRELAVREFAPNLGSLADVDGTRLDRLRAMAADPEKIKMMTFDQIEELRGLKQPAYDFEIANINAWCRKHGYTCHVSLRGQIEFRKRCSGNLFRATARTI